MLFFVAVTKMENFSQYFGHVSFSFGRFSELNKDTRILFTLLVFFNTEM